jgi:HSP20 family protein
VRRTERAEPGSRSRGALSTPGWERSGQTSPFGLMRRMFEDMDRLFGDFGFSTGFPAAGFSDRALWSPDLEVFEREDQLIVRADLPGLSKEDLDLELRDDTLVIRGQRKQQHEETRDGYAYSERSYGSFAREVAIPRGISPEQVDASFENGVLELKMKLPEQSRAQRRKLEIRTGESASSTSAGSTSEGSTSQSSTPQASTAEASPQTQQETPQSQPVK